MCWSRGYTSHMENESKMWDVIIFQDLCRTSSLENLTIWLVFFPENIYLKYRFELERGVKTVDCRDNYRDFHVSKTHGRVKAWNSLCQMTMKKGICLGYTVSGVPVVWKWGQNYIFKALTEYPCFRLSIYLAFHKESLIVCGRQGEKRGWREVREVKYCWF